MEINHKDQTEINEIETKKAIAKISEPKSWFFEKIKLRNLQPDSSRKKRERTQINKIRNEKRITADITEVQRIIRDYYQPLCGNKMDILEEMNKFLERYSLPRPNQEETENNYEQTNPSTEIKTD